MQNEDEAAAREGAKGRKKRKNILGMQQQIFIFPSTFFFSSFFIALSRRRTHSSLSEQSYDRIVLCDIVSPSGTRDFVFFLDDIGEH